MRKILVAALLCGWAGLAAAQCRDNVVLVHGNSGSPSDFDNTWNELRARGWAANQIFRPNWGSKTCAACNDHNGSEETPVETAISQALASSCTGKVDIIGHSMGNTLAARVITRRSWSGRVDAFVSIAGAFRGLWTCGTYPFNVATSTCGAWGLSINSPLLVDLAPRRFGARAWSIKSWSDQIVCATGVCTVGGIHSSTVPGEAGSSTYVLGHFGLLTLTATEQVNRIQ